MTHCQRQPATFQPGFPELLLLRANRPPSVLCCFSALIRRTRPTGETSTESSELELAIINGSAMLEPPPPAPELVFLYEPQSARLPGIHRQKVIHRGRSADTLHPPTPSLRFPQLGPRSLSATLPNVRQQQQEARPLPLEAPSMPSLVGSLLRRRVATVDNGDTVQMRRSPASQDRRGKLAKQFSIWNGQGDAFDGGDCSGSVGHRHSSYHSTNCADHTVDAVNPTICNTANGQADVRSSQVQAISSTEVDIYAESKEAAGSSSPVVAQTSTKNAANESPDVDNVSKCDSDIVELYLDSILESLSEIEDAVVESADVALSPLMGPDLEINIDIDELLLHLEEPIGESTECEAPEAAHDASEAELARGRQSLVGEGESASATVMESATVEADVKTGDSVDGHGRRLSDTGSELANGEFHFLRTRTLPAPPIPLPSRPVPAQKRADTLDALLGGGVDGQFRMPADKTAAAPAPIGGDGRRRIRRRQQSYAMGGLPQCALSDWGDDNAAVLLSTRPPPPPPSLTPPSSASLPRQATLRNAPPLPPPRAVIFHPPALADRAEYLANYLASSGQPACRWTRLPSPSVGVKQRRSASYRRRFAERLFSGSSIGRQVLPELNAALRQCAAEGHLPILLLPHALKTAGDRNNNNSSRSGSNDFDKFCRQLRAALADLQQPGLTAGLVVVSAVGSYDPADAAAGWSAAAGATTPTLIVPAPGAASDAPGPECCRAILAATRQCAALSALQRLL